MKRGKNEKHPTSFTSKQDKPVIGTIAPPKRIRPRVSIGAKKPPPHPTRHYTTKGEPMNIFSKDVRWAFALLPIWFAAALFIYGAMKVFVFHAHNFIP